MQSRDKDVQEFFNHLRTYENTSNTTGARRYTHRPEMTKKALETLRTRNQSPLAQTSPIRVADPMVDG